MAVKTTKREPGKVFIQGYGQIDIGSPEYKEALAGGMEVHDKDYGNRLRDRGRMAGLEMEAASEAATLEKPTKSELVNQPIPSNVRAERMAQWMAGEKQRIKKAEKLDDEGRTPFQQRMYAEDSRKQQLQEVASKQSRLNRFLRNPESPGARASARAPVSGISQVERDKRLQQNIQDARDFARPRRQLPNFANQYAAPAPSLTEFEDDSNPWNFGSINLSRI